MTNQIETEQLPDKRTRIVLDATMFDTFLLCPQKFYFRHKLNRSTPVLARPLDRGQLIHSGLEGYFKAIQQNLQFNPAVEAGINEINKTYQDSDLDTSEVERVKEVFLETCRVNRDNDYRYEILAVEEPFAYELYADEFIVIIMIGKIDLLINDHSGGYMKMPVDHKSYERETPVHRKTNQFCNYTYAIDSMFLLVNRIGFQTSIKPELKHKRIPLSYDPVFLEQWKKNVVKWCYFYLECEETNSWPLNDTSCDKYNRLCEYYSICDTSGEEGKVFKLETNFKEVPKWDVSKSLGHKT